MDRVTFRICRVRDRDVMVRVFPSDDETAVRLRAQEKYFAAEPDTKGLIT
jgi:hypothetical protein